MSISGKGFPARFANVWIAPGKTVEITGAGELRRLVTEQLGK